MTRTVSIAKYIADLITYLRITSSQGIKKQGDFWGQICPKDATYEAGNKIDRDLPYKINNQ
jgi:hypothetical protein